jgi:hypothetical protein
MKAVIDYEVLFGTHFEEVIKEVSVASKDVHETFRFLPLHHERSQFKR